MGFIRSHVETISTLTLQGVEQNQNGEFRQCEKKKKKKAKTPRIQRDMWESSGINKHENVERKTRQNIGREDCGFGFPVVETRAAVRTHTSSRNCIFIGWDGAKKHRSPGDISPPTTCEHPPT